MRVGIKPEGRAPAREGTEIRSHRGRTDRQGHVRRLRPERQRPDRHGLCRKRLRRARHAVQLIVRGKELPASVVALPFVPHRYVR